MEQFPSPKPSPTPSPTPPVIQPHNITLPVEHPKILQSLLYGNGYMNHGYSSPTTTYHQQLFDPNDPFRPRSGSLQSLGSTASSFRPDRPPSRESNSSHESLNLRASPVNTSDESSFPSIRNNSKLFNILSGNITSSFNEIFDGLGQQFQLNKKGAYHQSDAATPKKQLFHMSNLDSGRHNSYSFPKRHVSSNTEEGPIDLSYKSKKSKIDSMMPRRFTMPAGFSSKAAAVRARIAARTSEKEYVVKTQQDFLQPVSSLSRFSSMSNAQLDQDCPGNSILKSILNGNNKEQPNSCNSLDPLEIGTREVMSAPASPAAHSFSEPASPCTNFLCNYGGLSSCDYNAKVTIAKKTLFPVRARVTDWIQKTVQFAKTLSIFSRLSEDDQLILIVGSWARILLLYMAEYHFEFAVTPVSDSEINQGKEISSQETPTMKSIECIESFIRKCQNLSLDSREYEYIKVALIFHSGINGVRDRNIIEDIRTKSRQDLQEYERSKKPFEMMRYSNILLLLHTLSGINATMVQNLFCGHIICTETMRDYIKNSLKALEN